MKRDFYFPYLIEVVTDVDDFEAPCDNDVIQLNLSVEYRSLNCLLFKALWYIILARRLSCQMTPVLCI